MKLYYIPASCSLAAQIVIRELGMEVELIKVDYRTHTTESGDDFFEINELGYVPVLELDNGERLREGSVILQYLADLKPELGLTPIHGTLDRYRLQEWLAFLSSEIHKGFIPLLYPLAAGKYLETATPKLIKRFEWLDQQLARNTYLMGEGFTVADAYLFALIGWGSASWLKSYYHAAIHLDDFAHLRRWYENLQTRTSVIAAVDAQGL